MNFPPELVNAFVAWLERISIQVAVLTAVVFVASILAGPLSARFRHALWFLVFLRVFLPPSVMPPISVTSRVYERTVDTLQQQFPHFESSDEGGSSRLVKDGKEYEARILISAGTLLISAAWSVGFSLFWLLTFWRIWQVRVMMRRGVEIDEGPLRIHAEKLAFLLGKSGSIPIVLSRTAPTPMLAGLLRPRIILPASLLKELSGDELDDVLLHELTHWKRGDLLVVWVATLAQSVLWFHPALWLARSRLRHERECACDETVIRASGREPALYAQSLLKTLLTAQAQSSGSVAFIGVMERTPLLHNRMERIMKMSKRIRIPALLEWPLLILFAVCCVPMAVPADAPKEASQAMPPGIASTSPAIGAKNVDPALAEIVVTFAQDMKTQGWSWTGGGEAYPAIAEGRMPVWRDTRTCALPVKIEVGKFYRIGVNSTGFHNFRTAQGQPIEPAVLYFTTQGATPEVEARLAKPKIVKMDPPNHSKGVNPYLSQLKVTFDIPMGPDWSWTGGGENFPEIPEGRKISWSPDGKVCTLPVKVKQNWTYKLGLNSRSFNNFQSASGVPLDPVVYSFTTGDPKTKGPK